MMSIKFILAFKKQAALIQNQQYHNDLNHSNYENFKITAPVIEL